MSDQTQLTCPKCGRIFWVPTNFSEPTAHCPHCQSPVVVPFVAGQKADPFDDLFELDSDDAEPETITEKITEEPVTYSPTISPDDQTESEDVSEFELLDEQHDEAESFPGISKNSDDSDSLLDLAPKKEPSPDPTNASPPAMDEANDDVDIDLTDDSLLDELASLSPPGISNEQETHDPYQVDENKPLSIEGISTSTGPKGTFSFACPICDSLMYATPNQIGQSIRCEDCHAPITVEASDKEVKNTETKSEPEPEPQLKFRNEELALFDDNYVGGGNKEPDEVETDEYTLKPIDDAGPLQVNISEGYSSDNQESNAESKNDELSKNLHDEQKHIELVDDHDEIELIEDDEASVNDVHSIDDDAGFPTDLDPVARYTTIHKPVPAKDDDEDENSNDEDVDEETRKRRDSKEGGAKELSDISSMLQLLVKSMQDPLMWAFGGIIWLALSITFATLGAGAAGWVADDGPGFWSFVGIFFGSIFLLASVGLIGTAISWTIESMRKSEKKLGNIIKAEKDEILHSLIKGTVTLAIAIAPGFFFGMFLWAVSGVAGPVAIFSAITLYVLFPFCYISASYNLSPVQVYSPKIIATMQSRQMAWVNVSSVVCGAGVAGILAFAAMTIFPTVFLAPVVAAVHTAAILVMARATGMLNRAIMIALDR